MSDLDEGKTPNRRLDSWKEIADYLKRERAYVAEAARELSEAAPFRKDGDEAP